MNEYQILLKEWLDALIRFQISGLNNSRLDGAILCPSCCTIHGRCGDAIYPLVYMYSITGEEKYLSSADALFEWTEANMIVAGGGYNNGVKSSWTGITVFAAIGLGKTLLEHRNDIGEERYSKWLTTFLRLAHFLDEYFKVSMPNINYAISYTAELAIAYKLTGEERYKTDARYWYEFSREKFTPDGLVYGEGTPMELVTDRGCRSIDLGYNVEESLPNLVLYAKLLDDKEALEELVPILKSHLEFMLPDGGWDNSYGSRFAKWSYWGSRTADGCQTAYVLLADKYPEFGEAAHRSFELYSECTIDGLLAGGPMYKDAGEPPCSHHTFCHAKAMAVMAKSGYEHKERISLPRENADGIKHYPSLDVLLIARGDWRATVSGYDFKQYENVYPTGGVLTMLWNNKCGPLAAASMTEYKLLESGNMQQPKEPVRCSTIRIEMKDNNVFYRSINDTKATINSKDENGVITVNAIGVLKNATEQSISGADYSITYVFTENEMKISARCGVDATLVLPVVSSKKDEVSLECNKCSIVGDARKTITVNGGKLMCESTDGARQFNPVGGLNYLPLEVNMLAGEEYTVTLSVE